MDTGCSAAIAVVAQWMRCAHHGTALSGEDGVVLLDWENPLASGLPGGGGEELAGLTIGPDRAVYHAVPEEGRIVRLPWQPGGRAASQQCGVREGAAEDLLELASPLSYGEFSAAGAPARQVRAAALAFTSDDLLAVLDAFDGSLLLLDLADRRLVHRLRIPGTPVDLAAYGDGVLVACAEPDAPLWRVGTRRPPRPFAVPAAPRAALPADAVPARVAVGPGDEVWLLWRRPEGDGWPLPVADARAERPLGPFPAATDVELDGTAALVIAGPMGADLRRLTFCDDRTTEELPLRAPGYDARGLTRTPDGRIGYWGKAGMRTAFAAQVRYREKGWVDTFALDSGKYQQRWGRLFVDACLPPGTSLSVGFLTSDELPGEDGAPPLPHTLPQKAEPPTRPLPPGPPLAPADAAERLLDPDTDPATRSENFSGLYRRGHQEVPWARQDTADPFVTYETPVNAPPGRYLWLRLLLTGTPRATPRIRALRVERTGHRLLELLPDIYSAEPRAAAFLDRFLALASGPLTDLDAAAADRHLLLDPAGAPPEFLPWVASLVGLTLDGRWPEQARRMMIAEAVDLFRARGTVAGLTRMLEIYLGLKPVLVERFRFRGLGDAAGPQFIAASGTFADYAHRFSVVVPGTLSDEQRETVRHLLEVHRPAHTRVEVCSAGSGARVGIGWHLELTSVLGRSSRFQQMAVGGVLDRTTVLGQPTGGLAIGSSRLGADARVEP
ncbi:phage tail protein [Streptomyces sp. NPDC005141]